MRFSTALVSTALLAAAAFASPHSEKHRRLHKSHKNHKSHSKNIALTAHEKSDDVTTGAVNGITSDTWAGAVLDTAGVVTSVSGEFIVPTPRSPPGASLGVQYCASIWVGIDGDSGSCGQAILQTGIDVCVENGFPSFKAWYEWWPALDAYFDDFFLFPGQTIRASVEATANNAGTAKLENLSTGKTASYSWNGDVQANLCQYDAEWIVEDFASANNEEVPFVDFGSVTFTNAQAKINGTVVGPQDSALWDITQNGVTLAHTTLDSNGINIAYAQ